MVREGGQVPREETEEDRLVVSDGIICVTRSGIGIVSLEILLAIPGLSDSLGRYRDSISLQCE